MDPRMTRAEQNLMLLQRLIPESEGFYIWCYDRAGSLIASSCPQADREVLDRAFRVLGGLEKACACAADTRTDRPRLLGSSIGMQWAVTFESERRHDLIFVIGPVFYTAQTASQLRPALSPYTHSRENAPWAAALCAMAPRLPVMSYAIFVRYVALVHNTLTGQQVGPDVLAEDLGPSPRPVQAAPARDRTQVYWAERALLQMVRNGDLHYQHALRTSSLISGGVPVRGADPLRQMKTSIVVFTTLVSRAAMEGGLSPEIAYPLGDSYIQAVEDCRDSGELNMLAHTMYHDFIRRVHHLRANPGYSPAIQKCCDFIELNTERKLRAADVAALAGYSEYYLTDKFRRETGMSLSDYIRVTKMERAKVLLESTVLSVQEISEQLAFTNANYFIRCFRQITGSTPAQYRKTRR